MKKAYSRIDWQNQPSTSTALGATNLNKMDIALNTIDDRVMTLDTTKLDLTTANSMVKSFSLNQSTGVITITLLDGTVTTYDTKLEKLAVNFAYDATAQQLVITLDDGTKQYVDMSALITQYEFKDSSTVGFAVDASGKVSASVKNGSITADKLQPNYLADITAQQQTATAQAKLAKRYAVGGVETGDTTDNAKYYKEQAELFKTQAKQYRDEAQDISNVGIAGESKLGLVKGDGNVEIESDGDMWADPYKDKGTATGKFINFQFADDAMAQVNIKGATTVVPTNPHLPISPDNKASLVSPLNFDLVSCGDNMLNLKGAYIVPETQGITTTLNEDGSVTVNGTCTGNYVVPIQTNKFFPPIGTYRVSGKDASTLPSNLYLQVRVVDNGVSSYYVDRSFNVTPTTTQIGVSIQTGESSKGMTFNNVTIYPKIERGSVATPYTPYKGDKINIPLDMGEWNEIKDGEYIEGARELIFDGRPNQYWTVLTDEVSANGECAYFRIGLDKKGVSQMLISNLFKYGPLWNRDIEGITLNGTYVDVTIKIKKSRLITPDVAGLMDYLSKNNLHVRYKTDTEITRTPLNTYLKTFKGTTNIYTTANPQVELTATFKSQLWTDLNNHQNAIESKFDTNKIINSDNVTEPGFVPDARRVKAARDDITILQSTLSNTVSVKNYGAVGNGLANDTLAFQKALSYLENGGVLYIPSGTYLIHEILYVPSNVKVIGLGDAILKRNANINAIMLTKVSGNPTGYSGAYNITIENIIFDGSQSAFTPQCTLFGTGHATNINVQNCTFKNLDAWHMVEFNSTKDSKIYGCVFDTYGYNGTAYSEMIQLDYAGGTSVFPWYGTYDDTQCKNIKITNNIFRNCKGSAIGNHSFKSGVLLKDIYVQNNIFESIENYCLSLCDVENYYISNNTFINIRYAIILTNQANNNTNIIIDNNSYTGTYSVPYVSNEGRFIGINPTGRNGYITSKVKITNNIIKKANLHGIGLTANDVIINGNVITNCYLNGIYFYGGSNCVISANTVSDNNIASQAGRSDVVVGNNSNDVTENLTFTGNNVYSFIAGTNTSKILLISNNIATLIRGNAILEDNIIGNALDGESTTLKTVTAVSTYGTLASGGYIKTGKIITVNLSVNITTEVPALTSFITGLPVGLVNLTALAGFKTSGAVLNGFYVAVDTIRCASILPVGNYTISGTYLTY